MRLLEERIRKDGVIKGNEVLKAISDFYVKSFPPPWFDVILSKRSKQS